MIFKIVQYSIFSFVIISVIHYLISHLTENLTTPQVRDLVHSTNDQYETIIKKLEGKITRAKKVGGNRYNKTLNTANEEMKESLKTYLKTLNNGNDGTSASRRDGLSGDGGYSSMNQYSQQNDTMFDNPRQSLNPNTNSNMSNHSNNTPTFDAYDSTSSIDELAYSSY